MLAAMTAARKSEAENLRAAEVPVTMIVTMKAAPTAMTAVETINKSAVHATMDRRAEGAVAVQAAVLATATKMTETIIAMMVLRIGIVTAVAEITTEIVIVIVTTTAIENAMTVIAIAETEIAEIETVVAGVPTAITSAAVAEAPLIAIKVASPAGSVPVPLAAAVAATHGARSSIPSPWQIVRPRSEKVFSRSCPKDSGSSASRKTTTFRTMVMSTLPRA